MRKQIVLLVLMLIIVTAKAQFSIGYRQNIANHGIYLEPPSLELFQAKNIKPSFGLVISYINMNNAGIQAEINYAQKGWREVDDSTAGSFFERNINYLEIPVLTHFEIGSGKVRPVILAGPFIAFKLSESSNSENFDRLFTQNAAYNHYEESVQSINIGIKAGLGLRYNISDRFGVYAEGIYTIDMAGGTDVFKDS